MDVVAPANGTGNGKGNGHANGNGHATADTHAGTGGVSAAPVGRPGLGRRPDVPYVSPLRGGRIPDAGPLEIGAIAIATGTSRAPSAELPPIVPPEPVLTHDDASPDALSSERDLEPALPDEARDRVAIAAASPTVPIDPSETGHILHVRFSRGPSVQLVPAMEALRQVIRERPGETQVVVHVPGPAGAILPMPLRTSVAYDAELLAEIHRRVGEGIVDLGLA
jgi:hypothetical protein